VILNWPLYPTEHRWYIDWLIEKTFYSIIFRSLIHTSITVIILYTISQYETFLFRWIPLFLYFVSPLWVRCSPQPRGILLFPHAALPPPPNPTPPEVPHPTPPRTVPSIPLTPITYCPFIFNSPSFPIDSAPISLTFLVNLRYRHLISII
jgi:hypothetical protein